MNLLRFVGPAWLALSATCASQAQGVSLQGTYVNDGAADKAVASAIETAASQFSFLIRPIARARLKKTNPVPHKVAITQDSYRITITFGKSKPIPAALNAGPVKWTREDGEVFDLSTTWQGSVFTQTFVAPDGSRINRFSLSADGNVLSQEVTLSSPQLKRPITYTLVYRREAS